MMVRLAPLGIAATLAAWVGAGRDSHVPLTALYGLPLIAALLTFLWVLVLLRRSSQRLAEVGFCGIPCLYMIANQLECSLNGQLYSEGDPIGWLWLPVLCVLTFMVLDHRLAQRIASVFLGIQAAIYFSGLFRFTPSAEHFQFAFQYYIASVMHIGLLSLYGELKQRFGQVQSQAATDELTGLTNRRQMQALLDQAVVERQEAGEGFSVLLLDIDHFKRINDRYGHKTGDEVLRAVSTVMSQCIRKTDCLSRWGGEEFIVLLPGADLAGAGQVAESILTALRGRIFSEGVTLTASIGAAAHAHGERPEDVVHRSDVALYQAKQAGRDRVVASVDHRLVA